MYLVLDFYLDVCYVKCGIGNNCHLYPPRLTPSEITLYSRVIDNDLNHLMCIIRELPAK